MRSGSFRNPPFGKIAARSIALGRRLLITAIVFGAVMQGTTGQCQLSQKAAEDYQRRLQAQQAELERQARQREERDERIRAQNEEQRRRAREQAEEINRKNDERVAASLARQKEANEKAAQRAKELREAGQDMADKIQQGIRDREQKQREDNERREQRQQDLDDKLSTLPPTNSNVDDTTPSTTNPSSADESDDTEYLGGVYGNSAVAESAPRDTVSYWDGDEVKGKPSIRVSLKKQCAYFYKGGQLVGIAQLSTGREATPKGKFTIIEKDKDHEDDGEMPYFMGITKKIGFYAGFNPGYPNTPDRCMRMPEFMAENFFNAVSIGTPVTIED